MVFLDLSDCENGDCFPLLEVASDCSIICKIFRKDLYYHLNMLPKRKRECVCVSVCVYVCVCVCVCVCDFTACCCAEMFLLDPQSHRNV